LALRLALLRIPTLTRPRSAEKQALIVSAATELFAARGYANVTVPEIAARARVGLGTLYLRFPSKEALGNAVFRRCKLAWKAAVLDPWVVGGGAQAELADYWSRLARFVEELPHEARYLEESAHGHPLDRESQALREALSRTSAERVAAWIASGQVRRLPIEVVGALVHGTFWRIFLDAPSGRRRALLSAGRDAVWRALVPDARDHRGVAAKGRKPKRRRSPR
jgi:AcrR family transcriptional regulator